MSHQVKAFVNLNKAFFLRFLTFFLSFSLSVIFIYQCITGYEKSSWNVTEWLINYEGGFVRRGLPGQLILFMYEGLNVNPYFLIIGLCAVSYITFVGIIFYHSQHKKFPNILLPSAFLLGGPIINDFWVRKDVTLLLFFISALYIIKSYRSVASVFAFNIIIVIAILCHETFGFWALSTLILVYTLSIPDKKQRSFLHKLSFSFGYFSPSIIVFLVCIYFKGNLDIANTIWASWEDITFPKTGLLDTVPPAAIHSLSWSLRQGMSLSFYLLVEFSYGIYVPVGIFFTLMSVYLLVSNSSEIKDVDNTKSRNKIFDSLIEKDILAKWLIIQFVLIFPLFILGWDYGRWIFIWCASSLSLFLILPLETHQGMRELGIWRVLTRVRQNTFRLIFGKLISRQLISQSPRKFQFLVLLFLFTGVSVTGWNLLTFIITSPLGIISQLLFLISRGSLGNLG